MVTPSSLESEHVALRRPQVQRLGRLGRQSSPAGIGRGVAPHPEGLAASRLTRASRPAAKPIQLASRSPGVSQVEEDGGSASACRVLSAQDGVDFNLAPSCGPRQAQSSPSPRYPDASECRLAATHWPQPPAICVTQHTNPPPGIPGPGAAGRCPRGAPRVIRGPADHREVLVIGGGVSGLTAAIALAEAGYVVQVAARELARARPRRSRPRFGTPTTPIPRTRSPTSPR